MESFNAGPFVYAPARLAGPARQIWSVAYGNEWVGESLVDLPTSRHQTIQALSGQVAQFTVDKREAHEPEEVHLIDSETGDEIGYFLSHSMCGMTPGLIDDRAKYWLRSENRRYSRALGSLSEFGAAAADHYAPFRSWIADLLPDDVLTTDPEEWRAPTAWEIRHIVGEGAFTSMPGATVAALVGVTPQNFRKYTAQDSAASRQNISFAMWHLLLHKLGVQRA